MANRDVSQLLLQVDANVAVAQRNLQQLSRVVSQESGKMDASLGKVADAHGRMTLAGNSSRIALMEVQHVARASADQFAAGTPLVQIFTQHISQLAQAGSFAGASLGKFGSFLGGPWGIAITLATVILGKLALGHKDAGKSVGDLVDKMREQADQAVRNRQADELWKGTIQGLTEAIRKRREEQQKSLQTDVLQEESDRRAAQKELEDLTKQRDRLSKQIQGFISTNRAGPGRVGTTALGHSIIEESDKKLAQLEANLAAVNRQIALAEANVRGAEIPLLDRRAEDRVDKVKAATDVYNASLGALHAQYTAGQITLQKYNAELDKLKANLKAVQDAAKDHGAANRQSGRQVSFAEATSIAHAAGFQVNSGFRSVAAQSALFNNPAVNRPGNPVAAPGASAHNGANGKWAIDIQITDGVTPGKIRKVFADQGVSLTKVLKEKGHFHVEGSRSEAAHAENEAQAAAEKSTRQQDAFVEARDRLNEELLAAESKVVSGIDHQARVAEDLVRADEARRDQAIRNGLAEGRFGDATSKVAQARAAQLEAINHSVGLAKIENIERQKEIRQIQSSDQDAEQDAKFRADALEYQDSIATTQADHRRLQLDILDIVYQEKEAHLRSLKLLAEKNGDLEEANRIQNQINHLPEEKSRDTDRVRRGTMDPLEAWAKTVPQSAAEINQALHSIEAQGIENLASALTDVIMGTKSLGEAFKDISRSIIADIIQMTVRMLIFRALTSVFGGIFGGGGMSAGAASTGESLFNLPGFASGGLIDIGGNGGTDQNILSINGVPRARVSSSEQLAVIPSASRVSIPNAANNNGRQLIEVVVHSAPSDDAWAKVEAITVNTTGKAAPVIVRAAVSETTRQFGRPRLSRGQ